MAQIVLIFPRDKVGFKRSRAPLPLSILCLGSYLAKEGFHVKLIDQRLTSDWRREIRVQVKDETLCFGISSMTGPQIREGIKIAKFVRELNPDLPIVWGGVHVSLTPQQSLKNDYVDIVVVGEGEEALKNLAYALRDGNSLSEVKGIAYRDEGKYIYTGKQAFIDPYHTLNLSYDLVEIKNYMMPPFGSTNPSLATVTSRGCSYNCSYCYHSGLKAFKRWRPCKPDMVFEHLKTLNERFKIDSFKLWDDNFFCNQGTCIRNCLFVEKLQE